MYSPPVGGAARRPSATIDKQHRSKKRFIISGEDDYLCRPRNSASGRAQAPSAPSCRGRPGGPSLPVCIHFAAYEVIPCLALSGERELIAANERFCRQRARIVVRRHHTSVRAGAHDCEQIAFMRFRHFPAERKKISRLTHRSDNIDLLQTLTLAHARIGV